MNRSLRWLLFVIGCLLMTGCVRQQILDRVALYIVCGIDAATNNQIAFTIAVPSFQSQKLGTVSNKLYSNIGYTSTDIKERFELELNKPINPGKLSMILLGKDFAAKGLKHELDMMLMDPQASRKMDLAVVDGKAEEMLQAKFSSHEEKGLYLLHLIGESIEAGLFPRQNLQEFDYALVAKGMDPYLPLLKLQNDQVVISGLALFKDDKHIASINVKQMRVLTLLIRKSKYGIFEVKRDDGAYVAVKNVGSNVHYRFTTDKKGTHVAINLKINGVINDSRGIASLTHERQRLEGLLSDDLTATGTDLIRFFQDKRIDPLGLGEMIRSKTRNWNAAEWDKEYPKSDIRLTVKVMLTEMGVKK